ncbi:MAG: class I SAM-dependent methyltransferase [Acidimicrobiia bacterium]|nr:class I SAM-dependent methyltransferase [Acidimicrobiia bacterium]
MNASAPAAVRLPIDDKIRRDVVAQQVESVLEIGAMLGDRLAALADVVPTRIAIDNFQPYSGAFVDPGAVFHIDGWEFIKTLHPQSFDAVLLIDFIEHLSTDHALELLDEAKRVAAKLVIVFTPLGMQHRTPAQSHRESGARVADLPQNPGQKHVSAWEHADLQGAEFITEDWTTMGGRKAIYAQWVAP